LTDPRCSGVDVVRRAIPFEMVEADYCYQGSLVDPATGESVDLLVLGAEDGVEQNIDLA